MSAPTEPTGDVDSFSPFNPAAFTRAASLQHRTQSAWSVFGDVYQTILGAAVLLTYAGALLYGVRQELLVDAGSILTRPVVAEQFAQVPPGGALCIVLLLAAAGGLLLASRLGPVSVTRAQGYWWLGLPVDRRKALRGRAAGKLLRTMAVAGLAFLPVAALSEPAHGALSVALGALAAAGLGAQVFLAAALAQVAGIKTALQRIASAAMAVALLVLLAPLYVPGAGEALTVVSDALLVLPTSWPLAVAHGSLWPLAASLFLVAAGTVAVFPQLNRLSATELISSGGISGHTEAAMYFGDFREMGRALAADSRTTRRFGPGRRVPFSPSGVLIRADALALLRARGKVRNLIGLALVPAAVACISGAGSAVVMSAVLLATGWAAASATAAVAREYAARPVLDRLLPLDAQQSRRMHTVVPLVSLTGWSLLSFGTLALMGAGGTGLAGMGVLTGAGLAGAAMRSAHQQAPDWSNPGGSRQQPLMPAGVAESYTRGPDFAVLAMLPSLIALVGGTLTWWLVLLQLATSLVCLWLGTREPDRMVALPELVD